MPLSFIAYYLTIKPAATTTTKKKERKITDRQTNKWKNRDEKCSVIDDECRMRFPPPPVDKSNLEFKYLSSNGHGPQDLQMYFSAFQCLFRNLNLNKQTNGQQSTKKTTKWGTQSAVVYLIVYFNT